MTTAIKADWHKPMNEQDGRGKTFGGLRRLSDRELILRFADRRDQDVFRLLVERHGGLVFGVCREILRNHHDAEDAFQATFLVLAQKADTVRWQRSLANWLYGVAYRISLKAAGRRQRRQEQPMGDESDVANGFREIAACETGRTLHEELNELPERYRVPLILCYLQGKTRQQAADELGCTVGSVKGRLQRGRHELRLRMLRRGIGVALPAVAGGAALSAGTAEAASSAGAALPAVPDSLVSSTVEAAAVCLSGGSVGGAVCSEAITLAQGELTMLSTTTVTKQAAAAIAAVLFLSLSYLLLSGDATAEEPDPIRTVDTRLSGGLRSGQRPPLLLAAGQQAEGQQKGGKPAKAREEARDDLKAIQGRWRIVEAYHHGRKMPAKETEQFRIKFTKDEYIPVPLNNRDKKVEKNPYTLMPSTNPKQIDLVRTDGAFEGENVPGIYKLQGDKLSIAFNEKPVPNPKRPTKFAAEEGDLAITYFVLERGQSQQDGSNSKGVEEDALDQSAAERKRLQGIWKPVEAWNEGRDISEEAREETTVRISGNRVIFIVREGGGTKTSVYTLQLDPTAKPKEIDLVAEEDDETIRGVYRLQGNELTMSLKEGGPRLREFTPTPEPDTMLVVLKRRQPESKGKPRNTDKQTGARAAERQRLLGTWKVLEAYSGGRKETEPTAVQITGEHFIIKDQRPQGLTTSKQATYGLDPSAEPKRIDIMSKRGNVLYGIYYGIYRFQEERLEICFNEEKGGKRPTKFLSERRSDEVDTTLLILERQEQSQGKSDDTAEPGDAEAAAEQKRFIGT